MDVISQTFWLCPMSDCVDCQTAGPAKTNDGDMVEQSADGNRLTHHNVKLQAVGIHRVMQWLTGTDSYQSVLYQKRLRTIQK